MIYALDTNIVTFMLKEDADVKRNADLALDNGHKFIIPKIVDYEVRRGLLARHMDKKLKQYLTFRQTITVGAIDDHVWEKAIYVYAALSQIGKPTGDDGDVLIAAFCLVNGYTLVTNNRGHFEHINGLNIVDWKI